MRILKQEYYFPIIVGIHLIFWTIDLYFYNGSFVEVSSDTLFFGEMTNESWANVHRILGEVFSSWVVTVFAFNFLMATRAKWLERLFGGLDKMYLIHRRSGVIAVVLLFAHFLIVPRDLTEFTPGKPMGFYAFVLILIGVVVSASPFFKRKIPYHKWLNFHKFMGLFYVLGIAHALNVKSLISELPITRIYVFFMSFIGIAAWFYRAFLFRFFNKKLEYQVEIVLEKSDDITELILKPVNQSLQFIAGQFAFFTFPTISKREQHPFTISSAPNEKNIRLTIKGLGDYTNNLSQKVKVGDTTFVEGAYGHFTQTHIQHNDQIWIAGGIGITPFLSLAKAIKKDKVMLYWCVNDADEAIYYEELDKLKTQHPNFDFKIWTSNTLGYLTAEKLQLNNYSDKSYLICGPEALKQSLMTQLKSKGVSMSAIHDEEFAFR